MIEGGSCFDADNAFVQGTKIFDVEEALSFKIVLSNSNEKMYMFYTHNIFDFEDPEQPVKTRLIKKRVDVGLKIDFDLTLHNLELTDDIYSPFKSSEEITYLTLTESEKL